MKNFDPISSWNAEVASRYDDHPRGDEEDAARFLAELAGPDGEALEFAIGTGRIAIPLQQEGVRVQGIEGSPEMVERLRAKRGGEALPVIIGDMSQATTGRHHRLVYLVYNTIFNLLTADDQIRCFENAARHLEPGGFFVVETALPHTWMPPGQSDYVRAEQVEVEEVAFDVARYDPATQLMVENHVCLRADGVSFQPIVCRLISPGEMDLMARIAGLELVDRFGDWRRSRFDANAVAHVSVYAAREEG